MKYIFLKTYLLLSIFILSSCALFQQEKGVVIVSHGDKNALYYNLTYYSVTGGLYINLQICIPSQGCCAQEKIPLFRIKPNERIFLFNGTMIQSSQQGLELTQNSIKSEILSTGDYVAIFQGDVWRIQKTD